jgi:hypothetical protein
MRPSNFRENPQRGDHSSNQAWEPKSVPELDQAPANENRSRRDDGEAGDLLIQIPHINYLNVGK